MIELNGPTVAQCLVEIGRTSSDLARCTTMPGGEPMTRARACQILKLEEFTDHTRGIVATGLLKLIRETLGARSAQAEAAAKWAKDLGMK